VDHTQDGGIRAGRRCHFSNRGEGKGNSVPSSSTKSGEDILNEASDVAQLGSVGDRETSSKERGIVYLKT
jgi:hypothetical protein